MTYQDSLDFLFHQLPMYQRQGATAMKKDLSNIRALLNHLGQPQEGLRCIHVAGTNGKGTVCHLLAAALQQQGYRVGMYTSPHYRDFRERIKINGKLISREEVIAFTKQIRNALSETLQPSFFEITVALAFKYFAREEPDFCIIEVGLGGRLDSTNIIDPLLSVITNIGLDHTQFLGTTLAAIAEEKAGIIKANTPVVIGKRQPETEPVFSRISQQLNAPLTFAEDLFRWVPTEPNLAETTVYHDNYQLWLADGTNALPITKNPLIQTNDVQRENMITALAAMMALQDLGIETPPPEQIDKAWSSLHELTHYIGRFQELNDGGPRCLADSAHNTDGVREVVRWLEKFGKPLYIVLGMVKDKQHDEVLALFPDDAEYYFVKADIPRGLPAQTLREIAEKHGLSGLAYPSVQAGYEAAKKAAAEAHDDQAIVFVGGSVFVVAEVI